MPIDPSKLHDIILPAEPLWWPPAVGWWLLPIVVGGALAWVIMAGRRWYLDRRPLWELKRCLNALSMADPHAALQQLSALTRRYAMARYGRARVAALCGDAWLAFLADSGGDFFRHGGGRILATAPYSGATVAAAEAEAARAAVLAWAQHCRGRQSTHSWRSIWRRIQAGAKRVATAAARRTATAGKA